MMIWSSLVTVVRIRWSCGFLDEYLVGNRRTEGAVLAVDAKHQRSVEGVLLSDLDPYAGAKSEGAEKLDDLGIGGAWHGNDRSVARLQRVERRHLRHLGGLLGRDREAVGARRGPVEGDEQAGLDLL